MEETDCPACPKGTEAGIFIRARSGGASFSYWKCRGCGLVYLNPRPDDREILGFYADGYSGAGDQKFRFGLEVFRRAFARQRMRRIQKFFPRPGNALDVGCGPGTFLRLLAAQGWDVRGTELTEQSASRAARLGVPVFAGDIDGDRFPKNSFDVISFWQVLEHLRNPWETLQALPRLLKKGGIAAISTPNVDSLQAQVGKDRWFHLDPPRHLYLFSPRTLGQSMESLGFRLVALHHFSLEQNPYGWLQTFLNRTALPEGSLYELLKSGLKTQRGGLTPFQKGKAFLLGGLLLPNCLFWAAFMALLHRGATFEAYFRLTDPSMDKAGLIAQQRNQGVTK